MGSVDRVEIVSELRAEPELIVCKALKYNGRKYQAGERIRLAGGKHDDLLLAQHFFTTPARWQAAQARTVTVKHQRDTVHPAFLAYSRAEAENDRAQAELAAAKAALEGAKARAEAAAKALGPAREAFEAAKE